MKFFEVEHISWEEIREIWSTQLWPGRKSTIEPTSAMNMHMGITLEYLKQPAYFLGIRDPDTKELVGVNSYSRNTDHVYRSRGLWVHPEYRGQGLSTKLLNKAIVESYKLGASLLWSLPRQSSFPAYQKCDFERYSEWSDDFEFGPNCYAMTVLAKNPAVYWNWHAKR